MMKKPPKSPFAISDAASKEDQDSVSPAERTMQVNVESMRANARRREPPAHFLVPVESPEHSVRVGSTPVAIGRSPQSQLPIEDRSVSSQHCLVQLRDGALWVEDLHSTNGTFVDGRRITR